MDAVGQFQRRGAVGGVPAGGHRREAVQQVGGADVPGINELGGAGRFRRDGLGGEVPRRVVADARITVAGAVVDGGRIDLHRVVGHGREIGRGIDR